MNLGIALLAAITGYLSGSISYAVLITRLVAPGVKLEKIRLSVPDSDLHIESDAISAATVRYQLGARYGCLVGILDMAKAAVPALLFRFYFPETPYYLIAAGMTVVGHNLPVFHRFRGGVGLSSMVGGMLVVDGIGLLAMSLISSFFGIWRNNRFILTRGGSFLMIPWLWLVRQDLAAVIYAIAVNIFFWIALIPEFKQMRAVKKSGSLENLHNATQLTIIGEGGAERVEELTIPAIRQKVTGWLKEKLSGKAQD